MSLFQTWSRYNGLTQEQKLFLRKKQIQDSRLRTNWIDFLSGLAAFDKRLDKTRSILVWTGIILLPLTFVLVFIFHSPYFFLLYSVSILCFLIRWRLTKLDLPAAPDQFILPLFTLLREEVAPTEAISLKLDLRGSQFADKLLSESGSAKNKVRFFRDPWIESSFLLGDGSRLHWEVVDIVRVHQLLKRGSSGKYKWKTKVKVRRTIEVRLRVKAKTYAIAASESSTPASDTKVKIKPGEMRSEIRIRKRFAPVTAETPPEISDLVDSIVAAYRHLNTPENQVGQA